MRNPLSILCLLALCWGAATPQAPCQGIKLNWLSTNPYPAGIINLPIAFTAPSGTAATIAGLSAGGSLGSVTIGSGLTLAGNILTFTGLPANNPGALTNNGAGVLGYFSGYAPAIGGNYINKNTDSGTNLTVYTNLTVLNGGLNVSGTASATNGFISLTGTSTLSNMWNVINVKFWGAKGDGVTLNEDVAIQSALNYAGSLQSGGIVYAPAGRYLTSNQLTVASNVKFVGDGPSTIIENQRTNTYVITSTDNTNVIISDLAVKGHGVFDNSSAGRAAIKLVFSATRGSSAVLQRLWIYNSGVTGIGVDEWSDVYISDVFVYGAAEHGSYFVGVTNVVVNNLLVLTNESGVGAKIVNCTNLTLSHCAFKATQDAGVLLDGANRCTIQNCVMDSCTQQGIRINAGTSDCIIQGNLIYKALQDEIRDLGSTNTLFMGNFIYPFSFGRGIVCGSTTVNPIIFGNSLFSGNPDILVNSQSVIANNTTTGLGNGVEIDSLSTNTLVSANNLLSATAFSDSGVNTIYTQPSVGYTSTGASTITTTATGCTNTSPVTQIIYVTAATGASLKDNAGTTEFSGVTISAFTPVRLQTGGKFVGTAITYAAGTASHAW